MFLYSALFWPQLYGTIGLDYEIRFGLGPFALVRIVSQHSQVTGIIRQALVFASGRESPMKPDRWIGCRYL